MQTELTLEDQVVAALENKQIYTGPDFYRVIVTGSRSWRNTDMVTDKLRTLEAETPGYTIVIVQGCATGLDHIARSVALGLGYWVEDHFPDYWAHAAGKAPTIRNQGMVDLGAEKCLGWPTTNSKGTYDCLQRAHAAGIPTQYLDPDTREWETYAD